MQIILKSSFVSKLTFNLLTDPRCKVIRSLSGQVQQVDVPIHCSSGKLFVYVLLWFCHTCNALWVLRRLSHFLQFTSPSFGQLAVFCIPLHSLLPSLRFISFHSLPMLMLFLYGVLIHPQTLYTNHTYSFRIPQSSFHFITLHYVIHSFQ